MVEKTEGLHTLIITGLSGAGKTQVINCLEDMDYYCVDNLPPALLTKFVELSWQSEGKIDKVALVIDVRGGEFFHDLSHALEEMQDNLIPYEILFLEAADDVLIRRFKESRRRHPLASNSSLLESIRQERGMLEELRGKANLVIDTSNLTPLELKNKLQSIYCERGTGNFFINIISFGYKLGIPMDSDIVMDVRFLANPFYDPVMRNLTGEDQEVIDFVLLSPVTKSFVRRFINLLKFLVPYYIGEGKTSLVVAIGCTGGQHRSVVLADYTGKKLKNLGYKIIIRHRDIAKYQIDKDISGDIMED
ncbi:MAG TPA: RNase adapter RapZ [Syntrophomonadaceae bacterium]|nr:RNase adapter RapZ [Syntrophomonadaceae bacterium]HNX29412.1 RNase adapter RapZ [Syntrophomonadaceae bacterium]HPR93852.1 RNase adapter RapZ [Syntrophomonadaceae bacterium]